MNAPNPRPTQWQRTTTRQVLVWFFRWHMLRRLLLTIAVLITLPVLFYAVEDWRGKRAWDNCRQALESRGERLTLTALAPPPVPESKNLALAPILKPLFDFTRSSKASLTPSGCAPRPASSWASLRRRLPIGSSPSA